MVLLHRDRIRKWSSKTRDGCRTCRQRRVKCDELRPACVKCSSTGRSCAGYEIRVIHKVDGVAARQPVLLPKGGFPPRQNQIHAPMLLLSCKLTADETRAFDYFREHAALHLSGLFACAVALCSPGQHIICANCIYQVWNHLVLQGSHQESTILHASIAVGALYQCRQTWDPTSPISERENRSRVLALSQYSKALVELRNYIDRLDGKRNDAVTCAVLLACLLFVSFEMLQGASCTVNAHLVTGLKVLSDHIGTKSINRLQRRAIQRTTAMQPDIDDLAEIFIRLDADSTMFRRRSPFIHSDLTKLSPAIDIPCTFTSIKEAKVQLDTLSSLVFAFRGELLKLSEQLLLAAHGSPKDWARHYCIAYANARQLRPHHLPHLAHQRQTLLNALDKWSSSLAALKSTNRRAVIHLRVTKFLPYFLISTLQDTCEIICDRFEDQFKEVVDLAVEFMSTSESKPFETYKFVPEAGILASLYLVGLKCRNPCIRRKATDLLLASTIQEGLWTGCIYGRCVKRVMNMEEARARVVFRHRDDEEVTYVPEEARFSDVIIDTGMDDEIRTARIICARFVDGTSSELEVMEDIFSLGEPEATSPLKAPSLWEWTS